MVQPAAGRYRRIAQVFGASALLFCIFTLFSIYVWTAPLGWAWHLFYGRHVSFQRRKLPVPWDFFVIRSQDDAIAISRPPSEYALIDSPSGMMLIASHRGYRPDLSKDYDKFTNTMADLRISYGVRLRAVRRLSSSTGIGYCWEFMQFDYRAVEIVCYFDKNTLSLTYTGSPEYREEFYSVVAPFTDRPPELVQ